MMKEDDDKDDRKQSWLGGTFSKKGSNKRYDSSLVSGDDTSNPPKDRFYLVYFCMIMGGVGYFTPWMTYTGGIDYFFYYYQREFPSVSVAIQAVILSFGFLTSIINLTLLRRFGIHSKIILGYVISITAMLAIPLLDIGIHNCTIPTSISFYPTILCMAFGGIASGIQQPSYYALAYRLPWKYTQAVTAGESVSSVIESIVRTFTKLIVKSERIGGILYLCISVVISFLSAICHYYIRTHKMVIFYRKEPTQKQSSKEMVSGGESSDQQHLLSQPNGVELEPIRHSVDTKEKSHLPQEDDGTWGFFKGVMAQIWPLVIAGFITATVTLLLFPGLVSEIQDCSLGSWTPVLLVLIFNANETIGRWLVILPLRWPPKMLILATSLRIIFIPLVILSVSPSPSQPILGKNVFIWGILFTIIMGVSSGYFTTMNIIAAAAQVKGKKEKDLTGYTMGLVLVTGLLVGSLSAYGLTPFTSLAENHPCSNETAEVFDLCNYNNSTF